MSRDSTNTASFAPAQPQRWDLLAAFAQAFTSSHVRGELRAWCGLAIASLAVAGVFALLLALSRVPSMDRVFPWPLQFFERGLVIHVVFSFVVWFLSVFAAYLTVASARISSGAPRARGVSRLAIAAAAAAAVLLFIPGLMDGGEPSLNNYVPVIINPVYYAGLLVLAGAIGLAGLRLVLNLFDRSGPLEPVSLATLIALFIYVLALICFAVALVSLEGDTATGADNEILFWSGGHILQFLNTGLLLVSWYVLGGLSLGRPLCHPQQLRLACLFLAAFACLGPVFLGITDAFSVQQRDVFTLLQYGLAPPALVVAAGGLMTLRAHRRQTGSLPWHDPAFLCLVLSVFVFAIGGALGLFVDGADTRTPAHYHGVIGGINLAFMGVFFAFFLPLMGRGINSGRSVTALIHLYAWGQILASLGLFLAGGYGAPRKTAADAQSLENMGAVVGLYMNGVGALIAVIGGVMFIWIAAKALLKRS